MSAFWNLVIVLSCLIETLSAFHTGAPSRACDTATPSHGKNKPQERPSLYSVITKYSGDSIIVTIEDSKDHTPFKGFLLQAFNKDGSRVADGEFLPTSDAKTLSCDPGAQLNNALTHTNNTEKTLLRTRWIPPNGIDATIFFKATIVKEFSIFWVGVQSNSINVVTMGKTPKPTSTAVRVTESTSPTPPIDVSSDVYSGCGSRKGCFGFPNNCLNKRSCAMVLTYTKLQNQSGIAFELVGSMGTQSNGWFAMGLSRDDKMGDDSVTECVLFQKNVLTFESWNYATQNRKYNNRLTGPSNITTTMLMYENGIVTCRWIRPLETVANRITFDVAEQNFYILLAKGSVDEKGEKMFHHSNAQVSASPVDLLVASLIKGKPPTAVKLHGSLMTIAWICFVSIAMLIARHFKEVWPKHNLCGTKIWFTIHRSFMVLSILCVIAGFVIIFLDVRGWSVVGSNPHPILGIISTALMVLQPIIAILRPPPDSPKRPIFRWIHGIVGNGAQILACVNMFFAVSLSRSNLPTAFYWVLATFIVFHCLVHLLIHVHSAFMEREREREGRKSKVRENQFQPGDGYSTENEKGPGSAFKTFALGIYSLVVIGLTAALVLMICLN